MIMYSSAGEGGVWGRCWSPEVRVGLTKSSSHGIMLFKCAVG